MKSTDYIAYKHNRILSTAESTQNYRFQRVFDLKILIPKTISS